MATQTLPRGRPKGDKRERTRARLLEAARQLIREKGYDRTTMQDVAERAGMTWPLIADVDESDIEARLFPKATPGKRNRAPPDGGLIHRELRRKGVTLQLPWITNWINIAFQVRLTRICPYGHNAANVKAGSKAPQMDWISQARSGFNA